MLKVFLEEILNLSGIDDPRSDWLFGLLFFLDENFWSIDFLLFEFAGFNTFVDFGFDFFFFLEIFLDIDERVISQFLIIFDFGDLFDLDKGENYLRFGLLFFGLLFALFEVFEFHGDWGWTERYNSGSSTKNSIYEINSLFIFLHFFDVILAITIWFLIFI